jgi:hypothetical protein
MLVYLYIIIGLYRYHKNSIINKGLLSLVGFWLFATRACSFMAWTMWSFYSHVRGTVFLSPWHPCYESAYRMIAMLSLRLTFYWMRPIIDCHASLRLSCSYNVVLKHYAPDSRQAIHYIKLYRMTSQIITSTWTYCIPVCFSSWNINDWHVTLHNRNLTVFDLRNALNCNIILIALHY